jgi:hypothetical protein
MQRPGMAAMLTEKRWGELGRAVKPEAIPIVILQPFGPVMFVYDLADTIGPPMRGDDVMDPFPAFGTLSGATLGKLVDAVREEDRIAVVEMNLGFLRAGDARPAHRTYGGLTEFPDAAGRRFVVRLETTLTTPARFATLVHELAHIYCGHLGAAGSDWWPNRCDNLTRGQKELEAEGTAYLVTARCGLETRSPEYLANYIEDGDPEIISLDAILRAANRIEGFAGVGGGPRDPERTRPPAPVKPTPEPDEDDLVKPFEEWL